MKELEKRIYLSDDQYKDFKKFFNLTNVVPERQITTYYEIPGKDLRLMQTCSYCKVWLKGGMIHDICREEKEVYIDMTYSNEIEAILIDIFDVKTKWYRERYRFKYKDANICLDRTINYGCILELEIMIADNQNELLAENTINSYIEELGLQDTAVSFWNDLYNTYVANWKSFSFPEKKSWLIGGEIND